MIARARTGMRWAVWNLWLVARSLVVDDDDAPVEPPSGGAGSRPGRLRLAHLLTFRDEAKVLADRIGVTPGQLWGGGVRVGITDVNSYKVLIEFGGGTVLAARRPDPAAHPDHVRLDVEPTRLPLLLE